MIPKDQAIYETFVPEKIPEVRYIHTVFVRIKARNK